MSISVPVQLIVTHLSRLASGFKPSSENLLFCRCSLPPMDIYLSHLVETFHLEGPELLYASVYLKRLRNSQKRMRRVQHCAPYRLVLAALVVAHKYLRDSSYKNAVWGGGGNLAKAEMDRVELIMLNLLEWKLRVSDGELRDVEQVIVGSMRRPTRQGRIRLWREDAGLGKSRIAVE